jgi:hypothetical protein
MKKIVSIALVATLITTANAAQAKRDIHFGVGLSEVINNEAETEYKIGYGINKTFESGIYAGVVIDFGYSNSEKDSIFTYGTDGRLGVTIKDLSTYGIVSALYQTFDDAITGYAFGYGAGMEYAISDSFAVAVEYKSYSPTMENGVSYDYTNTNLILKYTY